MTDSDSDHRVNRRRFLQASGAASTTLASANVVSATSRNTCHFVQVGLDANVSFHSDTDYAPVTHYDDTLSQYTIRDGTLELSDHGAASLKAVVERADRVVDADHYQRFPATVQSSAPTTFVPIVTSRDFRPTEVLALDSEYRPPAVELDATGTTITATVGDTTFDLDAGSERTVSLEAFPSDIDVTERQGKKFVTVQQEAEIRPHVTVRNRGELTVVTS